MPLLGVLCLVSINLRQVIIVFAIGDKHCSYGRLSFVWLPECDKLDMLQPVFEQFGRFFRSRWKFEIKIEARRACKQLRIAALSVSFGSGQSNSEGRTNHVRVRCSFALGKRIRDDAGFARERLRLAVVTEIEMRPVSCEIWHLYRQAAFLSSRAERIDSVVMRLESISTAFFAASSPILTRSAGLKD